MKRLCFGCFKFFAVLCIGLFLATAAYSEDSHELGINKRISKQQERINQGVASGKLTAPESRLLQENLNWIKSEEKRLRSDGKLNNAEKEKLHRMLDKNSTMIVNKKQNPVRTVKP